MRKLATIETILDIQPIPEADAIEVATVRGWKVVIKKGEFSVGDTVVYCEIDSWIPTELAPFLSKGSEPKEFNGIKGERLRTVKLRGQVSQGLILPLSTLFKHGQIIKDKTIELIEKDEKECANAKMTLAKNRITIKGTKEQFEKLGNEMVQALVLALDYDTSSDEFKTLRGRFNTTKKIVLTEENRVNSVELMFDNCFGMNISDMLGIIKWEAPTPAALAGTVKGNFPSFISKTDQERIQNLLEYFEQFKGKLFEVSIKLDGSSCTMYYNNGAFGVCSRNLELKEDEQNTFWKMAIKYNIRQKLEAYSKNIAIQGEVFGDKIQGNPEKISGQDFRIFDVFIIDEYRYASPEERAEILVDLGLFEIQVPILGFLPMPNNLEEALELAEGRSLNPATQREGIVFKGNGVSFKVIANSYLLKHSTR